jgi:hypothetical protein
MGFMFVAVPSQEQIAFVEARRSFTVGLWGTFSEVRHSGYPNSRWDYELIGRGGQQITEKEAQEIDGQQVHVKATFSQRDKDYDFAVCLTNSPNWDLIITLKTGLGPNRMIKVSVPYDGAEAATAEVRNTLWRSLAIIGRARKSKPEAAAPKESEGRWLNQQLSRLTGAFGTKT